MQAIARANRIYPGKDCGLIVDYNGMLKSLREALAQYAIGDGGGAGPGDPAIPLEEYVPALVQAIEAAEKHLRGLGFDPDRLTGATGFAKTAALRDAVDALYTTDENKRRFEIMAREVFSRMKTLILEPSARAYYVRHDNLETIYKKLQERRDTADVTDVLKQIHKIVNEAVITCGAGADHAEGLQVDLSQIDFARLRDEFARKVQHKHSTMQDIRDVVDKKLAQMMAQNPARMDYQKQYQIIIADYNREKDRVAVEETFKRLMTFLSALDDESKRHIREGLNEDELALFDLLQRENLSKTDREKLKQASKSLLAVLREQLKSMPNWAQNETTRADMRVCILDNVFVNLPRPPFTDDDAERLTDRIYNYVWQRTTAGQTFNILN
jgi:type I restriction enzyme R subunit